MTLLVITVFICGYVLIVLEHRYQLHKAVTAAAMGALLWLIIALGQGPAAAGNALQAAEPGIFGLVFFLLAAMTLVEILAHYRFFDSIRARLLSLGLGDRGQVWAIGIVTFFLSAVLDNLTTTLVMVSIARRFFRDHNLLIAASSIVIAANAGGAWSPLGDVTTIMLWLGGKFSASEVVTWGFLPAATLFAISNAILVRKIRGDTTDIKEESISLSLSEKVVIGFTLGSFSFPLLFSQIGLAPYLGLLFGLGIVGAVIACYRWAAARKLGLSHPGADILDREDEAGRPHRTHLTSDIERALAQTDIGSLLFFAGILLAVAALEHVGVLEKISDVLLGDNPSVLRLVIGSGLLGVSSAIFDNIPLTAAALRILPTEDPAIWTLLALTLGTGGSMLAIGSAAGVVAMGRIKELTFLRYMHYASVPAALGYVAAMAVWCGQYILVR